jgi:hypothetical protein
MSVEVRRAGPGGRVPLARGRLLPAAQSIHKAVLSSIMQLYCRVE